MQKKQRRILPKLKIFVILALLFWASPPCLMALDLPVNEIPDDVSIRRKVFDSWFIETPSNVLAKNRLLEMLPNGEEIELRSERMRDEFAIVLAREYRGAFPGWAQGSWVITRNIRDGNLSRIRIFPRSDPYIYIQFQGMDSGRSSMDVVAYDAYLAQSISVPMNLERLLTAPLHDVLQAADNRDLFRYFEPKSEDYSSIRTLIARVRRFLPGLSYNDDGAISEAGDYVFINSLMPQTENQGLNCSGFAKWLIDGIMRPITGKRLSIPMLKQPYGERGSSFTEPYEPSRDPFFGLDWIRNLASTVNSSLKSPAFSGLKDIEVEQCPFSNIIARDGGTSRTAPYTGFLPDAGFSVKGLPALLYTLAINEPGTIYLGAVNNELPPKPRMRQYFHIAAFLPYFDERGAFHVVVFESAAETNFNRFVTRYPGHYVNLVRIPVETTFNP
ncbi:MAG: hypothetical protein LBB22_01900 [Treponema sp.]|jgi:hypothetical protein|nr:hypothetical protein [Treponema sp.]